MTANIRPTQTTLAELVTADSRYADVLAASRVQPNQLTLSLDAVCTALGIEIDGLVQKLRATRRDVPPAPAGVALAA